MRALIFAVGIMLLLASCNKKEEGQRIYSQLSDVGKLSGTVTSLPSYTPVKGAVISIRNAADTAHTDTYGNFLIPEVAPGARTVYVSKDGFVTDSTVVTVVEGQTSTVELRLIRDTVMPAFDFTGKWTGWLTRPAYITPLVMRLQQIGQDSIMGYLIVYEPGIPQYFPQDTIHINSELVLQGQSYSFNVYTDPTCHGYLQGTIISQDSINGIFFHYCNNETPVTEPWGAKRVNGR